MSARYRSKTKVTYGNRSKRMKDKQICQIGGRIKMGDAAAGIYPAANWTHLWRVLTPAVVCPLTLKGIRWDINVSLPNFAAYSGPSLINFRWMLLACKASESLPALNWDNPNADIVNTGLFSSATTALDVVPANNQKYLVRPEEKVIVHGVGSVKYGATGEDAPVYNTSGQTKGMRKLMIGDFFVFVFSFVGDTAATGAGATAGINLLANIQWVDLQ